MRKLVLQMSVSVDGVAATPKDARDLSPDGEDPALKQLKLEWLGRAGTHIMGRTTYQEMAGHWPYSDDAYAAPMNDIPKVVFSRTLTDAPWQTSRIARGDLVAEIDALKREPGGDIIAWGGAGFAHSLLSTGVIDEHRLVINPVLAGEGLRIFHPFPGPIHLRLARAEAFSTGAVLHVYDRAGRGGAG